MGFGGEEGQISASQQARRPGALLFRFFPLTHACARGGGTDMAFAAKRLQAERTAWRKEHPHAFYAKPEQLENSAMNMMRWKCGIPGPKGSLWEGAVYPVVLEFPPEFPDLPPKVRFLCVFCLFF